MQNYELVHSSKVKFIYPSEEEMGDLTFIVAERKAAGSAPSSSSRSFNVLLYLLVFQVGASSFFVICHFTGRRRALTISRRASTSPSSRTFCAFSPTSAH